MKTEHKNTKSEPLWIWNPNSKKRNTKNDSLFPVSEFLRNAKDSLLGPGAAAGIGCGAGLGFGVVGGFGFGGSQWNQLRLVFGVGIGCGIGLGIGYGQGFGYGYSLESFEAYLSEETSFEPKAKPKSNKGLVRI